MKKPVKKLSASETLEILDNQWASIEDIMKIAFIGETRARTIASNISNKVSEKGYTLPKGLIPMELLKDYLGINIAYLKKVSGR